jgi:hypothetical protein
MYYILDSWIFYFYFYFFGLQSVHIFPPVLLNEAFLAPVFARYSKCALMLGKLGTRLFRALVLTMTNVSY